MTGELPAGHKKEPPSHTFPPYSSPTSAVSAEETRVLTEYIHQQNLFKVTGRDGSRRKSLMLKQFFKMKRHQQVVVTSMIEEDTTITTEGKVATIGRNFVMLTEIQKRIWIPFASIDSATIPYGFPTYSNPHQYHIYDNQLQQKIVLRFGETVSKKDELIRQFFEETFHTNLASWKGTYVEAKTTTQTCIGKIVEASKTECILQSFRNEQRIPLGDIRYISTLKLTDVMKRYGQSLLVRLWKKKK